MPSRASVLTGRLQHGIESLRMEGTYPGSIYDPQRCPFIPAEFRRQGYQTAQIGKWHTGVDSGWGRDWDYQVVWNRPLYPDNAGNYYSQQTLTINGQEHKDFDGYSTDNYTQWAVDYIRGQHRDAQRPWYLWLCYGAIHGPTTPAQRHQGKLQGHIAPIPADIFGPWPGKPDYLNQVSAWVPGPDGLPAMRRRNVSASNFDTNASGKSYAAWVQQVNECNMAIDEGVGQLVAALKDSGQLDNTLIVYTADQGFALGEHGLNQKVAPYDASLASALILNWAGHVPPGQVCAQAVNAPDLMGYLCKQAEVTIPWTMHAREMQALVDQPQTATLPSPMLMTHTGRCYGSDTAEIPGPQDPKMTETSGVPWYALLRHGQYKYVRYFVEGEVEELYDLAGDPQELENLALNTAHAQLLLELRAATLKELRRSEAPFLENLPQPSTF